MQRPRIGDDPTATGWPEQDKEAALKSLVAKQDVLASRIEKAQRLRPCTRWSRWPPNPVIASRPCGVAIQKAPSPKSLMRTSTLDIQQLLSYKFRAR